MKKAKQTDYNRNREFRNIERLKRLDNELVGEVQSNLEEALIDIKRETNNWYLKYADDNGITVAEAQKVAESADIKELSSKAKQYVKWRHNQDFAFSEQANKEMREYNFSMRMSRQELLIKYMEMALSESFDKNDLAIGASLTKFGIDELRRQAGLLGLSVKDAEELKRDAEIIARSSFHGETFSERLWAQQEALQGALSKGIMKSILVGKNPTAWMTSMGQYLTDVKRYGNYALRRLAVTEAGRVQIEVQRQSYVESGYEEYVVICEPTACPYCKQYDDGVFKVEDMEQGVNSPIFHPNCVLGETIVLAPDAKAITKSVYSGDVIEIATAKGSRLSVTPNHIVLTSKGWVRAKNIVKGNKVIYYSGWNEVKSGNRPAENQSVPTIENLFTSCVEASGSTTTSMPATAIDFKGDVVENSKIDIVFVDSVLRSKLNTSFGKFISDSELIITGELGETVLPRNRTLTEFLMSVALAFDGFMSISDISHMFFGGSVFHHELIGRLLSSNYDIRLNKSASNNAATNRELASDCIFADSRFVKTNYFGGIEFNLDPGEFDIVSLKRSCDGGTANTIALGDFGAFEARLIEFDDVVDVVVRKNEFRHVYDVSSLSTLYIANGIVSSNCRCSTAPYVDRAEIDRLIAEKASFEPAKNIKEAEEFARDTLGVPNVSYKGVDIATANAWNEGLQDSFERFPELKNNFGFAGEAHERNRMLKPVVRQYYTEQFVQKYPSYDITQQEATVDAYVKKYMKNLQIGKNVFAVSYSPQEQELLGFRGASVNKDWGKNSEDFIEVLTYSVQNKSRPMGCETIRSVLDHEIGHQLNDMLGIQGMSEVKKLFDSRTKQELTNDISAYTWNNNNSNKYSEMIAEAWSEYCNNPQPREIAKTIGETIEAEYAKKFGAK